MSTHHYRFGALELCTSPRSGYSSVSVNWRSVLFTLNLEGANYAAALVTADLGDRRFCQHRHHRRRRLSWSSSAANLLPVLFGAFANLVGGIYYPAAILPAGLQFVARLIPVTYAVRAMRLALSAGASWSAIMPDILALLVFIVVLFPLTLLVFGRVVETARMDGSLAHY